MTATKRDSAAINGRGHCMLFTETQVLSIRYTVANDPSSHKRLAEQYGCSITTLTNICRYSSYRQYGGPMVERKKSVDGEIDIIITYPNGERPLEPPSRRESSSLRHDDSRRNCTRCGIRIFDTFEEAKGAIAHATEVNIAAKSQRFLKLDEADICLVCKIRPERKRKEIL